MVNNLHDFEVAQVFLDGQPLNRQGQLPRYPYPQEALCTVHLPEMTPEMLTVSTHQPTAKVNVITMIDQTVATSLEVCQLISQQGLLYSDPEQDVLKGVVLERFGRDKGMAVGFVKGFGLKWGAFAGSIGQDTQNMACVGVSDEDICLAINTVTAMQGGVALVADGQVVMTIPMPIFGIMTDKPVKALAHDFEQLQRGYEALGGTLSDVAFTLSLQLTLAVIPEAGLTNRGLVDVSRQQFIDVVEED